MIRLAALIWVLATGAPAQDLREASATLIGISERLEAAEGSRDKIRALTEVVQAYEAGLASLRDEMRPLAERQAVLEQVIAAQQAEIADLLGVLQTIGAEAPPALMAHPSGLLGSARAGMILSHMSDGLQARADALSATLAEIEALRAEREAALGVLQTGLENMTEARGQIARALADREPLPKRFEEDAIDTALLLAGAETLEALADGLAQTGRRQAPEGSADGGAGGHPLPVTGEISQRFDADQTRPGWMVQTAPAALVRMPATATILYAGPLLDYGNVVILEPEAGLMVILAGLAKIEGEVGDIVAEGYPIGEMGGQIDAILAHDSTVNGIAPTETLYIEVRDQDGPRDPATWFAKDEE
ncbi:murein hydrolase activator EnvC family protein [Aestuariibius insulae]|uniref:murein hydrolase activator EnvC family protein n=1 Tax=Aestuariibius insulae TaxID=2058287 RepID=UPI00345EAB67